MKKLPLWLFTLLVIFNLTACAGLGRDRRDALHDPNLSTGATLLDQIPAWEGAANKICCGHLRTCQAHQSPRC
jgi:hypothetical protein